MKRIAVFDDNGTVWCKDHLPPSAEALTPVYAEDPWTLDLGVCRRTPSGLLRWVGP